MSIGLKLIAASCAAGSAGTAIGLPQNMWVGEHEATAIDMVRVHYRQYRRTPDVSTVEEAIGRRLPTANEPIRFYVDKMHDRLATNLVTPQLPQLGIAIREQNMTAARALAERIAAVMRGQHDAESTYSNARTGFSEVITELQALQGSGGITGVEVGWPQYDRMTRGYRGGDLITFVGRPGMGKTWNLMRQSLGASNAGNSTLFVTTEMSARASWMRLAALVANMNPRFMLAGEVSTYALQRLSRVVREAAELMSLEVLSLGVGSTAAKIDDYLQDFDADLICIDSAHLVRGIGVPNNASRTERYAGALETLKAMSLSWNRPVVITTHFGRAAGKDGTDGSLETIGYTDAIGTLSSAVAGILPGPTVDPSESRTIAMLKGRDGESGRVYTHFKFAPTNMEEMTYEDMRALPPTNDPHTPVHRDTEDWDPSDEDTTNDATPADGPVLRPSRPVQRRRVLPAA
jgi:archaellum biogenesis ATPase FlaH